MIIRFKDIEPIYTGGNIWIFKGELENGFFFNACDDMKDFQVFDSDPRLTEESDYPEWQEAHLIEAIDCDMTTDIFISLYTWLKQNNPNCGIDLDGAIENLQPDFMLKEERTMENKIEFISLNIDGEQREWHMSPSELNEKYQGECDLPSLDDTIVSCVFAGVHLYFETFSDMVNTFLGE